MAITDILLLAVVGCAGGLIAGLLGVGGGILIVPVLRVLGPGLGIADTMIMHVAVATSAAVIVPTAIRSGYAHWQRGAVDRPILLGFGPAMGAAAFLAGRSGEFWNTQQLSLVFGVAAILLGLNMAFGRADWRLAERLPGRPFQLLMGAVIGAVSAVMGIGGGAIAVPVLSAFGVPMHRAVGTAAVLGLFVSLPALVGWILAGWGLPGPPGPALGFVSLPIAAALLPTMLLVAPFGVRLAHRVPAARLKRIFGVFLGLAAFGILTKAY